MTHEVPACAGTDVCLPLAGSRSKLSGWIILDKPEGMTSAHAVAKVKRLINPVRREAAAQDLMQPGRDPAQRLRRSQDLKIGHAGTLDPLASGVLPLALGEATKTVAYMMDAEKSYAFTVTWGEERDTDDREGQVTATSGKRPSRAEIEAILPQFVGVIQQTPPAYSALKINGKRAYELARGGEMPDMQAREVRVRSLRLLSSPLEGERMSASPQDAARIVGGINDSNPPTASAAAFGLASATPPQRGSEFLCHCGKGTYIRSLGRDMGRKIGCLGYISRLRRLKVGKFDETHAISLEMLKELVHKGDLGFLHPVDAALDDILARDIHASQAASLKQGQRIALAEPTPDGLVMAKLGDTLVAIGEVSQGVMKPVRVFNL